MIGSKCLSDSALVCCPSRRMSRKVRRCECTDAGEQCLVVDPQGLSSLGAPRDSGKDHKTHSETGWGVMCRCGRELILRLGSPFQTLRVGGHLPTSRGVRLGMAGASSDGMCGSGRAGQPWALGPSGRVWLVHLSSCYSKGRTALLSPEVRRVTSSAMSEITGAHSYLLCLR